MLELELDKNGKYESKDKNGVWWVVTLLKDLGDGTYQAKVHDGVGRIWPRVYESNIREARSRTPPIIPDIDWDADKPEIIINKSMKNPVRISQPDDGSVGVLVTTSSSEPRVYTNIYKIAPTKSRAHLIFQNEEMDDDVEDDDFVPSDPHFKLPMPVPQHSIYPVLRTMADVCEAGHNFGDELPEVLESWEKHQSRHGLYYWHNTETKMNTWKEPSEEFKEAAFERQLQRAMDASVANGLPRDAAETAAERNRLLEKLKEVGFKEVEVGGDGNCQFRSLAYFLKGDEDNFQTVRKEVALYLKKNRDTYSNFIDEDFDEYCEEMSSTNRWGDHVTLDAAANLYEHACQLVSSSSEPTKTIRPRDPLSDTVSTLCFSYLKEPNAEHYNPAIPVSSPTNKS
eukprot:TRINITY_DN824_c4_g1_i1.p1 TRINITY_DN824_c4_g1~~TRINITY_DN824_c4_g1_i1.p1  ORF type:complete len:398 (+),score=72.49 TRINITY_DN824_c4_g1_i1:523-1716(+)